MNIFFEPAMRPMFRGCATCLVVALLFALSSKTSAATSDPLDVVRLKNGGVVRGTILEAVPGETVRVQMSDGKVREFAADTIEYAGPERSHNSAPEVANGDSILSDKVHVHLVSPDRAATFGIRPGTSTGVAASAGRGTPVVAGVSADYVSLCTAPCAADLKRGMHLFNLTLPNGRAAISSPVQIDSAGQLQADYVSRKGLRAAGWVTMISGSVVGTLMALGTTTTCTSSSRYPSCEDERPLLVPGLVVLLASTIGGLVMSLTPDRVDTAFVPGP